MRKWAPRDHRHIYVILLKLKPLLEIIHLHLISYLASDRISKFFQINLLTNRP